MSYSSEVLADAPGAYYRMNEASGQPQDSSGNACHTTAVTGSPTYSQPGAILTDPNNNSILLVSDEFTAPDSAPLRVADVFTLECWALRGFTGAFIDAMFAKAGGGYGLNWSSDKLMLSKAGTSQIVSSTLSITDINTYHHCVATKNGSTVKLYLDGVDVTGTVTNATCVDSAALLALGNEIGSGFNYNGFLDEVAIYPTALSQARVQAHYNAAFSLRVPISIVSGRGRW